MSGGSIDEQPSRGPWAVVAGVLAVLLVVALAGVVALWVDREGDSGSSASVGGAAAADVALLKAGIDAEAAARVAIVEMTTYDWRTVDDDFAWVDDAGTEKFQAFFTDAAGSTKRLIRSLQITSEGTVVESAPDVRDATHVRVLLFVDQEIRAKRQRGERIDQPRVVMEMVLVDGRWLADEVQLGDLVGGQS